jgi:hypothetical protein
MDLFVVVILSKYRINFVVSSLKTTTLSRINVHSFDSEQLESKIRCKMDAYLKDSTNIYLHSL